MCEDVEGYLWVALSGSSDIRRYTPQSELEGMVGVTVSRVTSCGFGGKEFANLYIASHSALMTADEHEAEPTSGGLCRCSPRCERTCCASVQGMTLMVRAMPSESL